MTEIYGRVVRTEEVRTNDERQIVHTIKCPACNGEVRVPEGDERKCRCGFGWVVEVRAVGTR